MSTALYPDSPETAIFSCDLTIARRHHFSRDIASALGLWHQAALKRVQSHCLSSISENYNCARLRTIKSSVYTEHHSREKRYQALPSPPLPSPPLPSTLSSLHSQNRVAVNSHIRAVERARGYHTCCSGTCHFLKLATPAPQRDSGRVQGASPVMNPWKCEQCWGLQSTAHGPHEGHVGSHQMPAMYTC